MNEIVDLKYRLRHPAYIGYQAMAYIDEGQAIKDQAAAADALDAAEARAEKAEAELSGAILLYHAVVAGASAVEAERDALRARVEALEGASRRFVSRLDDIHDHERFRAVWTVAHLHIGPYDGPTYTEELAALRAALQPSGGHK